MIINMNNSPQSIAQVALSQLDQHGQCSVFAWVRNSEVGDYYAGCPEIGDAGWHYFDIRRKSEVEFTLSRHHDAVVEPSQSLTKNSLHTLLGACRSSTDVWKEEESPAFVSGGCGKERIGFSGN